ncbi:hypothetical protein [Paenibacillus hemerocallicola]|nr:hypothetical protein [Paenibacillus hemerocallicola]
MQIMEEILAVLNNQQVGSVQFIVIVDGMTASEELFLDDAELFNIVP